MEHYAKASSVPMIEKNKEPYEVYVKSGSKIRACVSQGLRLLQTKKEEKIVIIGSGPTVTKTITTAEIVKRRVKGLHQQNNLFFTKTEDLWEPKEEGLDQLKVTRNVPSISITLSTKPLDKSEAGYQAPGESMPLVQFRDEDIELADEKSDKRQGWKQHQGGAERTAQHRKGQEQRTAVKHKGGQGEWKRDKTDKDQERYVGQKDEKGFDKHVRGYRGKRGGHHGGPHPPKRPHQEKHRPEQRTHTNEQEPT